MDGYLQDFNKAYGAVVETAGVNLASFVSLEEVGMPVILISIKN